MATTIALNRENVEVLELERRKNLISHIEEYEQNPIIARIIGKHTTFESEVENFYNIHFQSRDNRGWSYAHCVAEEENLEKRGKTPEHLVEVLNGFNDENFDICKLSYNAVREDYNRWRDPRRVRTGNLLGFGGLLIGMGGITTCLLSALKGNTDVVIPAGVVGGGGLALQLWAAYKYPDPKGTNYELEEFKKLRDVAGQADDFMEEHYRTHFIRKNLKDAIQIK